MSVELERVCRDCGHTARDHRNVIAHPLTASPLSVGCHRCNCQAYRTEADVAELQQARERTLVAALAHAMKHVPLHMRDAPIYVAGERATEESLRLRGATLRQDVEKTEQVESAWRSRS